MAKWIFAFTLPAAMLVLSLSAANAQSGAYAVDGCARLARAVYDEVANAASFGPGQGGPWLIEQGIGDVAQCDHVAKTVSRAFSSAMNSSGYPLQFANGSGDPSDFCYSGFLSQCYPNREPLTIGAGAGAGGFTFKLWSAVSQTVMRQMHNPYSSDQIQFREHDLKLRLGLTLRSIERRADVGRAQKGTSHN